MKNKIKILFPGNFAIGTISDFKFSENNEKFSSWKRWKMRVSYKRPPFIFAHACWRILILRTPSEVVPPYFWLQESRLNRYFEELHIGCHSPLQQSPSSKRHISRWMRLCIVFYNMIVYSPVYTIVGKNHLIIFYDLDIWIHLYT